MKRKNKQAFAKPMGKGVKNCEFRGLSIFWKKSVGI